MKSLSTFPSSIIPRLASCLIATLCVLGASEGPLSLHPTLTSGHPDLIRIGIAIGVPLRLQTDWRMAPETGPSATLSLGSRTVQAGLGWTWGDSTKFGPSLLRSVISAIHVHRDGGGIYAGQRGLGLELQVQAMFLACHVGGWRMHDDSVILGAGFGFGL